MLKWIHFLVKIMQRIFMFSLDISNVSIFNPNTLRHTEEFKLYFEQH